MFKYKHVVTIFSLLLIFLDFQMVKASQKIDIDFTPQEYLLSVNVENASLIGVLKQIESMTGCQIIITGSDNDMVTASFSNLPLKEGIQRLAKGYSLAVIYNFADVPENTKVLSRISEIWLFKESKRSPVIVNETNPPPISDVQEKNESVEIEPVTEDIDEISDPKISQEKIRKLNQPTVDDETNVGFWANKLFHADELYPKDLAITELQRIDSDEAIAAISTVLGDPDPALRIHAVESMKLMQSEKVPQLMGQALLGDKDSKVRMAALKYFGVNQDPVSINFINSALKDEDKLIRKTAEKMLND